MEGIVLKALLVISSLILALIIYLIVIHNRLASQKISTQKAWSGIDIDLKRRCDLIPNLIESTKGYATFEASTLGAVAEARGQALEASHLTPHQRSKKENALSTAIQGLLLITENYPQLKASQEFLNLQTELTNTEDRIAAGRRFYNANVRMYRTLIISFPSSIVARFGGYQSNDFDFFQTEGIDAQTPTVDFGQKTKP